MSPLVELADLGLSPAVHDLLGSDHARRLSRTLDLGDDVLADGHLPLTWQWAWFTPAVPTSGLRDDGHPRAAPDSALAGMERRVFAGGSLDRLVPLRLDETAVRRSRVIDATHKAGRSGDLFIVTVEHTYLQDDEPALVETQDLIYRAAAPAPVPPPGPAIECPDPDADVVVPDERLLFRYSALTFNTHRIHYDQRHARETEGYPDLVVHGPLTATLLAGAASRRAGPLRTFRFRAEAPTFVGTVVWLLVDVDGTEVQARAVREDGVTVMSATATT